MGGRRVAEGRGEGRVERKRREGGERGDSFFFQNIDCSTGALKEEEEEEDFNWSKTIVTCIVI